MIVGTFSATFCILKDSFSVLFEQIQRHTVLRADMNISSAQGTFHVFFLCTIETVHLLALGYRRKSNSVSNKPDRTAPVHRSNESTRSTVRHVRACRCCECQTFRRNASSTARASEMYLANKKTY